MTPTDEDIKAVGRRLKLNADGWRRAILWIIAISGGGFYVTYEVLAYVVRDKYALVVEHEVRINSLERSRDIQKEILDRILSETLQGRTDLKELSAQVNKLSGIIEARNRPHQPPPNN